MNRTTQQPEPAARPTEVSRRGLLARLDPRSTSSWPWSARRQAPAPDVCDGYDT